MRFNAFARGVACFLYFHGNRIGLEQNYHYEINKDRWLSQYIKIFVFYLPYTHVLDKLHVLNKLDLHVVSCCDSQWPASLF